MIDKPDVATALVGAAAIATASPLLGDYMFILLFNLGGALVALSRVEPDALRRRWDGAIFISRSVVAAFSVTWVVTVLVAEQTDREIHFILWPIALTMGYIGDAWLSKDLLLKARDFVLSKLPGKQ